MAVTLTVQDLVYAIRLLADTTDTLEEPQLGILTRTLASATAQVERYAPGAPADVQSEAAIRMAAYLYDVPPGRTGRSQNAFRDCGAIALLSSWRVQRATALEG